MFIWENKIPDFLIEKKNIVRMVLFTALFALAFINFYAPFSIETQFNVTDLQLFFYSSLVILTGVLVVVISRILLYRYSRKNNVTYLQYALWIMGEIICMTIVYSVLDKYVVQDPRNMESILRITLKNTALVLLLPYTFSWLYFAWQEKSKKLEELSKTDSPKGMPKRMINFHDEKGTLRFSVFSENLLYIESADNYITVYYLNKGGLSRFLVRTSMKNMEKNLSDYNIIRCHRSFMVNIDKVRILRKEKDGLHLELDLDKPFDLPVSKTYVNNVLEAFSGNSAG